MDRFDRIFKLHKRLVTPPHPVSLIRITERCEYARARSVRAIVDARNFLGASIRWNRNAGSYRNDRQPCPDVLRRVADVLAPRQCLRLRYHCRAPDAQTERTDSPSAWSTTGKLVSGCLVPPAPGAAHFRLRPHLRGPSPRPACPGDLRDPPRARAAAFCRPRPPHRRRTICWENTGYRAWLTA